MIESYLVLHPEAGDDKYDKFALSSFSKKEKVYDFLGKLLEKGLLEYSRVFPKFSGNSNLISFIDKINNDNREYIDDISTYFVAVQDPNGEITVNSYDHYVDVIFFTYNLPYDCNIRAIVNTAHSHTAEYVYDVEVRKLSKFTKTII